MEPDSIHVRDYIVSETSDLEQSEADGTMEIQPGEEQPLIEFEPASDQNRLILHAIGGSDAQNVEYRLRHGTTNISFTAESPLGTINEPFSFTDEIGKPLSAGNATLAFTAINNNDSPVYLAARAHLEVR